MLVPLLFVLMISMVKDAWEDFKRKKADSVENRQPATLYRVDNNDNVNMKSIRWDQVQVGNIIELKDGEFTPADVVLLHARSSTG